VVTTETDSTGSALLLELVYAESRLGFDTLGESGKSAESVAKDAVDRKMADQLLIFLALAGGAMRVPALTAHAESNLSLLDSFGFDIRVERTESEPLLTAKTS